MKRILLAALFAAALPADAAPVEALALETFEAARLKARVLDLDGLFDRRDIAALEPALARLAAERRGARDSVTEGLLESQTALSPVPPYGPAEALARARIADLYFGLGFPDKAEVLYKEAFQARPAGPLKIRLRNALGCVEIARGGGESREGVAEGLKHFQRASMTASSSADLRALSLLGVCFSRYHLWHYGRNEKDWDAAARACAEAARIEADIPARGDLRRIVSSMYFDRGDDEAGLLHARASLELARLELTRSALSPSRRARLERRAEALLRAIERQKR